MQSKKMLIINILDILRKYSDENHRLSQKNILDILHDEYEMSVERKAVRRNILDLIDFGFDIEYKEAVRIITDSKTGETEERYIMSDFYLVRDFTNAELRLIIDGLLFSRHIPYTQCKELIGKLEGLSSKYFKSHVKHIHALHDDHPQNKQLFLSIEILDEAITLGRQVSFTYLEYGTDKKLHKRLRPDGSVREYLINPYQMVAKEGKYYLICNYDKYNDISNYRIDRIADVKMLDTPAKPFDTLDGAEKVGLDLAKYMTDHVYMYSGENTRVRFRIVKPMISDVIDMFGSDVSFSEETDTHVTVSGYVNETSMIQFAKNYAPDVVLLSPKRLVDIVKADIAKAMEIYN